MVYQTYIIIIVVTTIAAGIYSTVYAGPSIKQIQRNLSDSSLDQTTLWVYYDQSDVNSRWWADFGARSSRAIHTPYLNLCYQSIAKYLGNTYNIRVIAGLSDLAILLDGWSNLPRALQNPIAPVGAAELSYIRAAVLEKFGGLWVSPSTLFLQSLPDYSKSSKVILFGMDKEDMYIYGTQVMYSPRPNHPLFVHWATMAYNRIELRQGGKQFNNNDMIDISSEFSEDILYIADAELSRKPSGKRIQIEDLLSSGGNIESDGYVYVPIDRQELELRSAYAWFLRMSETQILQSDLLISQLFRNVN
jgi:hypothetical protein